TLAAAPQAEEPIIYVIDDDLSVRSSLEDLLASVGLRSLLFGSTKEFMEASRPDAPGCLILDIRMPGMSGLDFQEHMAKSGIFLPVIFITGHGDIPMSVRAMKAGAIEFLTKPFREQDLLDAIQQ
ncbi:LuxR family DNA-binding response regulator, partial [Pseudomonas syringae pv. actinidiae ICMP 18804]